VRAIHGAARQQDRRASLAAPESDGDQRHREQDERACCHRQIEWFREAHATPFVAPFHRDPGYNVGRKSMTFASQDHRDALSVFRERFGARRALIGMLHLGALPGTPSASCSVETLIQQVLTEARIYQDAGFTALAIENMHDRPYLKGGVGPEITAAMTAIARDVKHETGLVLGVQVLAGANREAIAIAHASGSDFVRVEGFVYAHVADEGVIESCAGELLRYRRGIGAERVLVFADVKKKHGAHAITADVSIVDTAKAAEFFLADGVIVTGAATGEPASPDEVRDVVQTTNVPVLVGSGITPANLPRFATAHGFIVGSSVKEGGLWCNPMDRDAVRVLAGAFARLSPDP
jgi:membrane complex biogenesis BtpA family protein